MLDEEAYRRLRDHVFSAMADMCAEVWKDKDLSVAQKSIYVAAVGEISSMIGTVERELWPGKFVAPVVGAGRRGDCPVAKIPPDA